MGKKLLAFYLAFREPENFLKVLLAYIAGSLIAHFIRGYDADFGATNLILSIEATIAGMAVMVVQRQQTRAQERSDAMQRKQLEALVTIAESSRQTQADQLELLHELRESDVALLEELRKLQ